jgi:hypothetical protein
VVGRPHSGEGFGIPSLHLVNPGCVAGLARSKNDANPRLSTAKAIEPSERWKTP